MEANVVSRPSIGSSESKKRDEALELRLVSSGRSKSPRAATPSFSSELTSLSAPGITEIQYLMKTAHAFIFLLFDPFFYSKTVCTVSTIELHYFYH